MNALGVIGSIANLILTLFVITLFVRLVFEYIPLFNREWRPRGPLLVVAEVVYTITDPPIKLLRRFIPPVRIGTIAIDLAFAITMLGCFVLLNITRAMIAAGA